MIPIGADSFIKSVNRPVFFTSEAEEVGVSPCVEAVPPQSSPSTEVR